MKIEIGVVHGKLTLQQKEYTNKCKARRRENYRQKFIQLQ